MKKIATNLPAEIQQFKARFTSPPWLENSPIIQKQLFARILFVSMLVAYLFKWGISIERSVHCLRTGQAPQDRCIDVVARWDWMSVVIIVSSLVVLLTVVGKSTLQIPKSTSQWRELAIVGFAWSTPLLLTRSISELLPESPCQGNYTATQSPWNLAQLSGPAEEIWFASTVALWMLICRSHFWSKLLGVLLGSAVLRGIFHIYQGWQSIGLFFWGSAAGIAVAMTGRWKFFFILHFINNVLIKAYGLYDTYAAIVITFICFLVWAFYVVLSKLDQGRSQR